MGRGRSRTLTVLACLSLVGAALSSPVAARASSGIEATATTNNWSGYRANTGEAVRSVSARWRVPSPGRTPGGVKATFSNVWVGIGGTNGTPLLQAGSESDATCALVLGVCSSRGTRVFLWYEIYPDVVQLPIRSVGVSIGDAVSATVTYSGGIGTFTVCNESRHQCATAQRRPSRAPSASAEWIVERPNEDGRVSMLANFGTVTIARARYTTVRNVSHTPAVAGPIDMVSCRGAQLARTSPYNRTARTFSVTWLGYGTVGC